MTLANLVTPITMAKMPPPGPMTLATDKSGSLDETLAAKAIGYAPTSVAH